MTYAWCRGRVGAVISGRMFNIFSEINIVEHLTVVTIDSMELRLTNIMGNEFRGRQF
jgi:hypothetical protein